MRFITAFLAISLVFTAEQTAITVNGVNYSESDFYKNYSMDEWNAVDSLRKAGMVQDFIRHKTGSLEAEELGLQDYPKNRIKIKNQEYRFLVNESYEYFVARQAISDELYEFTKEHLRKELLVHHVLIGYSGCSLREPIERSKQDALDIANTVYDDFVAGKPFAQLAEVYSDDPSVVKNQGKLGWLAVGKTIAEFQSAAYSTPIGQVCKPVLTDYGYHVILVEDERASEFADLSEEAYEAEVYNAALSAVYGKLRELADAYDTAILEEKHLVYNDAALQFILDGINDKVAKNKIVGNSKLNLVSTLQGLAGTHVVCVLDGKGYGIKWFADRFDRMPTTRHPQVTSVDDLKTAFRTILLQEVGYKKGLDAGLKNNRSFTDKFSEFKNSVLFDAYVKYVVNNIPEPSESEIQEYYKNNKDESFVDGEKVSVREIKVRENDEIDAIYTDLLNGADFETLARENSLTNPQEGGKILPFAEGRYSLMGQAAFALNPGNFSSPVENLDGTWSLVYLIEKLPEQYTPLEKVTNRIVSVLKRESQNKAKEDTFVMLEEKYGVIVNPEFFKYEN